MKTIIITLAFSVLVLFSYGQKALSKENYLLKSGHQKTAAWILLGAGAAMITTGALLQSGDNNLNSLSKDLTGVFIGGAGIVSFIVSLSLFASSAKNKKLALGLSLQKETNRMLLKNWVLRNYPAISFKVSF